MVAGDEQWAMVFSESSMHSLFSESSMHSLFSESSMHTGRERCGGLFVKTLVYLLLGRWRLALWRLIHAAVVGVRCSAIRVLPPLRLATEPDH